MRFENKFVLITGGNRGIGLAATRLFAAEGAKVILIARDQAKGESEAKQIPNAVFVRGDVSKAEDCQRAVEETVRLHGALDVLVNCAGIIYRNRTVEQTTEEEWDATFDVNVKGTFLMCKYSMPALRERKGSIVNVASYVGLVGFAKTSAYAASKAAIVNLTRSMALDYAREGVRVNAVCPGSVDTEMIHDAWRKYGDVEEAQRIWAEKHPIGRIANVEEVAQAILFLAGGEASFITGVALPVDGGITAG
ncbi:MAG TPA: SDR family oxidoreductase [Anaerolineales bacterium]|nr:SDR family oxidoreductase [Anaerolineales bacterium]